MNKHPLMDCVKTAEEYVRQGAEVYQKFQCQGCNAIQTMEIPNTFYERGQCEECGAITDIRITGCNYLMVMKGEDLFNAARRERGTK